MRIAVHPSRFDAIHRAILIKFKFDLPATIASISCIYVTKYQVFTAQIEQLYV